MRPLLAFPVFLALLRSQNAQRERRAIKDQPDVEDHRGSLARQARRDRKARWANSAPPDRRALLARQVPLASPVPTGTGGSEEPWGLPGCRDQRATPEPLDRREQKAMRGHEDCKAVLERPGRQDRRATWEPPGLRGHRVSQALKDRRETPDPLGWPGCRGQRAMSEPEARRGPRDSRAMDQRALRDHVVRWDPSDPKAPKAIRALPGRRARRESEDQWGLLHWISGSTSRRAKRCARPQRYCSAPTAPTG